MRRFVSSFAVSAATAAVVACTNGGVTHEDTWDAQRLTAEQAIINGADCDEKTDDTAIALLVDADLDLSAVGLSSHTLMTAVVCTGTLIAPDVVLTAAHCTDPALLTEGLGTVNSADYYVSLQADLAAFAGQSQTPPPLPESAIPVSKLVHDDAFSINSFNGVTGPAALHDIGLVFLSAAITTVEPEVVITAEEAAKMKAGDSVEIAGWGQQTQTNGFLDPPPPGTVGIKECGASTINELGDDEMQIGGDASTTRKCHGDSGGPTYLDVGGDHERTRRVIGVTSRAYDQADCGKGGIDTRVDVHLDWLNTQMENACEDGTRVSCDGPTGVIPPDFYDPAVNPGPAKKGCAAVPAAPFGLALALLALRRRRR